MARHVEQMEAVGRPLLGSPFLASFLESIRQADSPGSDLSLDTPKQSLPLQRPPNWLTLLLCHSFSGPDDRPVPSVARCVS